MAPARSSVPPLFVSWPVQLISSLHVLSEMIEAFSPCLFPLLLGVLNRVSAESTEVLRLMAVVDAVSGADFLFFKADLMVLLHMCLMKSATMRDVITSR